MLLSGFGGLVFQIGKPYATTEVRSTDCFAGARTIRVAPERSHTLQLSAWDQITECLHRHKRGVGEARPCREGNQAAIRRTGCGLPAYFSMTVVVISR